MRRPTQDLLNLAIMPSDKAVNGAIGDGRIGHDVLVALQRKQQVSWADRTVEVEVTRNALALAPQYDLEMPLTREMEIAVFEHPGRTGYWSGTAHQTASDTLSRTDA